MWSADPGELRRFPASLLAGFFDRHGMFGFTGRPRWRAIAGGSSRYVDRIVAPLRDRLRLSTPVVRIERFADRVEVTPARGGPELFDEVIVATHSGQMLAMLADPSALEAELLAAIPYQPNEVVRHTDGSLLPHRRRARASWNFHLQQQADRATVTYHMNRLQSLDAESELCVTLNRTDAIDPERVLDVHEFPTRSSAIGAWPLKGAGMRSRAGGAPTTAALIGDGFHEDGVESARRVCRRFGAGPARWALASIRSGSTSAWTATGPPRSRPR